MIPNPTHSSVKVVRRILICGLVLVAGVIGMSALAAMHKPPAKGVPAERPLSVEVQNAELETIPVTITGYGEVRVLDKVSMASEVSGTVVYVHPRLEAGEVIPQGEVLFRVDPSEYEAALKASQAAVEQLKADIQRLNKQYEIDQKRLKPLERNRELAKAQYERIQGLLINEKIGTLAGVEQAEQALNVSTDQVVQIMRAIELYPIQVRLARANLAATQAKLETANIHLRQCELRAPFDARIKSVDLETGQYITPGLRVLTLANDSVLEIWVPLDSRDAGQWLRFNGKRGRDTTAWFNGLEKVACTVNWTESDSDDAWNGMLHRIVKFDPQTRTLTVAIRIDGPNLTADTTATLPLVEGMFCSVEIPGKTLPNVFRLPRWAVSFDNTVHLAAEQRLRTVPVEVARIEDGEAFVSAGIHPGDQVIITRLVNPMENALLDINENVSSN
jgi:multidrug efflux pump subunit AcrA (membrane-fusion protein)